MVLTWSIKGQEMIINKLRMMEKTIVANAQGGLKDASHTLRNSAIETLISRMGGRWGRYSPSMDSIRDKRKWGVSKITPLKVQLTCRSGHAKAVEYGTLSSGKLRGGKFHASDVAGVRAFPVGASQGSIVAVSSTIRPFPGKHYLLGAVINPTVHNLMLDDLVRMVKKSMGMI